MGLDLSISLKFSGIEALESILKALQSKHVLHVKIDTENVPILENIIADVEADHTLKVLVDDTQLEDRLDELEEKIKKPQEIPVSVPGIPGIFGNIKAGISRMRESFMAFFAKFGLAMQGLQTAFRMLAGAAKLIVGPSAEFESLRIRLVNLYQDVKKGKEVFKDFARIAATTPFGVADVVAAGAQLKAFGLDAQSMIKPLADLAAYMDGSIKDAASAMGRAFAGGIGAADIFREKGINRLILSFNGFSETYKPSLEEFRTAMIKTFTDPRAGVAGATDRLADSLRGAISNFKDAIMQLQAVIGDHLLPTLTKLVRASTAFLDNIKKMFAPTRQEEIKQSIVQYDTLVYTLQLLDEQTAQGIDQSNMFRSTIKQLNAEYGDYIGHIDESITKYGELHVMLNKTRELLIQESVLRMVKAEHQELIEEAAAAKKKLFELNNELAADKAKRDKLEAERLERMDKVSKEHANQAATDGLAAPLLMKRQREADQAAKKTFSQAKLETTIGWADLPWSDINKQKKEIAEATNAIKEYVEIHAETLRDASKLDAKRTPNSSAVKGANEELIKLQAHYAAESIEAEEARQLAHLQLERRAALDKAKSLKASEADILNIEKVFARKELEIKENTAEKLKNAREKQAKDELDAAKKLAKEKEDIERASIDFEMRRLESIDPAKARYARQIQAIRDFYADKKTEILKSLDTVKDAAKRELALAELDAKIKKQILKEISEASKVYDTDSYAHKVRVYKEEHKFGMAIIGSLKQGFKTLARDLVAGGKNFQQVMRDVTNSMKAYFINAVIDMAAKYIEKKMLEVAISHTAETSKQGAILKTEAVQQASLARVLVLSIAGAIKQVAVSIWKIVAKIYSFFASFGPLGIPMAAGMIAAVTGAIAAFKKGFAVVAIRETGSGMSRPVSSTRAKSSLKRRLHLVTKTDSCNYAPFYSADLAWLS